MIEWFLIIAPLVFGYGSKAVINMVHAGFQNEEHGIKDALPALSSTYLVYIAYTVVIGFTYGWIIHAFPQLLVIVKYVSVAVMCGLAYLIWSRDKEITEENILSIGEEFLVGAIRPVIPLIVIVMFSVFMDVTRPLGLQVIVMTIGLVILNFITQVFWITAGQVLDNEFFSEKTLIMLDRAMAGLYVLLAIVIII